MRTHHDGAGIAWLGGYAIGDATAELRGNGTGATTPPFTLFTADSRIRRPPRRSCESVSLSRRSSRSKAARAFAHPRIGVSDCGDPEAAAQDLPGEELQQYVFDGGADLAAADRPGRAAGARSCLGGAGYLRQLHEDRTLAETGQIYYAGGGARYWLRGGHGRSGRSGCAATCAVNVRSNGIDFEDKMRTYPTFSVFVFIGSD